MLPKAELLNPPRIKFSSLVNKRSKKYREIDSTVDSNNR